LSEENTNTDVREIAGSIVASYLGNNQMPADQVPQFIANVISALKNGSTPEGRGATAEPESYKPAVPIKKSVGNDYVTCLVCGKQLKALKRHIRSAHGMDETDYREAFGLPRDHPLVSRNYSRQRADMAKQIGLGQKGRGRQSSRKKS